MAKPAGERPTLPVKYPSVPDRGSEPPRYNEPDPSLSADRVPGSRFAWGETRADLRLRIEEILRRREAVPEDAWANLGTDAPALLAEMLDDESVRGDEALCHRVIAVLGQLKVTRAIVSLSAILADETERPVTRAYAANALGRIGDGTAVDALADAARAKDPMLRRQVAIALGRIDRDAVVPHLLRLRDDPSVAVAEVAAEAVGRWETKLGETLGTKRKARAARKGTAAARRKRSPAPER